MDDFKKVSLPGFQMTINFLLGFMIPVVVFTMLGFVFFAKGVLNENNLLIGLIFFVLVYSFLVYWLSRYSSIVYSSREIQLIKRFGGNEVYGTADVESIGYFPWLRVYLENIEYDIEKEVEEEMSPNDFPDPIEDAKKNWQKINMPTRYNVYPVKIKTPGKILVMLIDEKTLKELTGLFGGSAITKSRTFKYNENWNWLIFAAVIFGICYGFVYFLMHP